MNNNATGTPKFSACKITKQRRVLPLFKESIKHEFLKGTSLHVFTRDTIKDKPPTLLIKRANKSNSV